MMLFVDAEPRWLTDDEREVWMSLIGMLIRLPAALDRQLQRDAGMSHFEYQVLAMLSEAPSHTLRIGALAERTEGSLPRLSQVVARLERRGWVERCPDPTDRRSTLARLTDGGLAHLEATAPGHVDAVRRLVFDQLTSTQRATLRTIGQRVSAAAAEQR